jgi:uncharacterized protein (AIM24 family)
MPSIISTKTSGGGGIAVTGDTSGVLQLASNNGTTAVEIDASQVFKFNSGYGSVATAYGCRAWVNFNGTGTVAIRGSGNVSSITDNGTGDYTVNFTIAMPDVNYCASTMVVGNDTLGAQSQCVIRGTAASGATTMTTTQFRVIAGFPASNTLNDLSIVNITVFR